MPAKWLRMALIAVVAFGMSGCAVDDTKPPSTPAETSEAQTPSPTHEPADGPTREPAVPDSDLWTAELAYKTCVDAPDVYPDAETLSVSSLAESEVDEYVPGNWTVIIRVVREREGEASPGSKVCLISNSPTSPDVRVTDSIS